MNDCDCNEGHGFNIDCPECFGTGKMVDWRKIMDNYRAHVFLEYRICRGQNRWVATLDGSPSMGADSSTPVGALQNLAEKIKNLGEEVADGVEEASQGTEPTG